jgi:serine/threonine-protein kinase
MSPLGIDRWQRASPHLDRVLDLPPTECDAYLMSLWAGEPEVAADVEALLAEHRLLSAEGFLESPAWLHRPEPALAGLTLGAYTLVSPIGHGGMGSVWLAERSDGRFHGQAALKLLNAALVGRAGEDRFKREGTILARLTHPHIGRLVDAGVSSTGQPFLVLEHINGRHIDRYCDDERLGIEDRIRLFLDVQSAVSHAHTSLIVHRDLKPSNILVTARGEVKLLDFGIAKLLEDGTGDHAVTLLTHAGDVAMTPKYAAPEQVTGGAITTATDVYALGVILFELLSGQHPTGADARTPAQFVKAVTEREPLRLSAAIASASNRDVADARAASRGTSLERLRRVLRGDLDTIIAKALKSDPAERYASVAEFADDLRRFLSHEPIAARGDALGYRAAKFARRHQRVVAAAAVIAALVVSLVVFYTTRLSTERDRARLEAARSAKVSELLIGLLTTADPYRTPDPNSQSPLEIGAQRIDAELAGEPALQARMFTMIGRTYERMGLHAKALPLLERALAIGRRTFGAEHVTVAQSLNDLGVLYREQGNLAKAEPLLRESLTVRRRLLGAEDKDVAVTLIELARVLNDGGRSDEAEPHIRESLAIRRKVFGEEHRETSVSKSELGRLLLRRGDVGGAEPLLRDALAIDQKALGADHPNTASSQGNLALLLMTKGDLAAAESLQRESLAVKRRVFGPNGLDYAVALNTLAIALEWQGRRDEARAMFEECLRIARPQLGDAHPRVQGYIVNLARVQIAQGRGAATESSLRDVLTAREKLYPAGDWRIAQAQSLLGGALLAQKRYAEAEPLMVAADRGLEPVPGIQDRERVANRARLVALYEKSGRPQQANALR